MGILIKFLLLLGFVVTGVGLIVLFVGSRGFQGVGRTQATITLEQDPDAVYPWVYEPDKKKQWMNGLSEVNNIPSGEPTIGNKWQEKYIYADGSQVYEAEIIALLKNRLLIIRYSASTFFTETSYELENTDGITSLTVKQTTRYRNFLDKVKEPLITRSAQIGLEDDLKKLKMLIEQPQ